MDSVAAQVISLAMANICPTWKLAFYKSWWHVIPHEVACSFDLQESGSIFRRGKCFGKNWQEVFAKPMSASRSKGDWTCSVLCFWTVWDYKARQKTFIHFEDPGRQAGSARVCKGLQGSRGSARVSVLNTVLHLLLFVRNAWTTALTHFLSNSLFTN
jgi:hypothetical protein